MGGRNGSVVVMMVFVRWHFMLAFIWSSRILKDVVRLRFCRIDGVHRFGVLRFGHNVLDLAIVAGWYKAN